MKKLNICIVLNAETVSTSQEFEASYQRLYKPLLSFLYSHPKFLLTMSFSGKQLSWLEIAHPEAIDILSDLTGRHQVEILGGAYYSPILPLLFPVDRSGQIEKLTAKLRSTIGKRPRGISLFGSFWDQSLVTTIQTIGMEYVLLDNTLFPAKLQQFLPIITSEQGKTLKLLPVYQENVPGDGMSLSEWIKIIQHKKKSIDNQIITVRFSTEEFVSFLEHPICEEIAVVNKSEDMDYSFTIPQLYFKTARNFIQAYIPAGMEWNIAQWAKKAYVKCENDTHFPLTIHDFLNVYQQNHRLYERMMYVSMLLSQCHGDKMRKLAARERLWEAQDGNNYISLPCGLPASAAKRQKSYRLLNEAEKLIREASPMKESVTSFDYNGDGLNEYVCQMEKYHAVITPMNGGISELDVINSSGNYAGSLPRLCEFDSIEDYYNRGLFVEHLLSSEELSIYKNGDFSGECVFSNTDFTERKFDNKRMEIQMEGKGVYSSLNQPVSLRKNYIVTSAGFVVQYILKNESPLALHGHLVVESNFAQTCFEESKSGSQYSTEVLVEGNRIEPGESNRLIPSGISTVQVTDSVDKTSFVFEPNEDCGFINYEYSNKRPVLSNEPEVTSKTYVTSLFWDVDLSAGMEMEKTVNFGIIPAKKRKLK